MDRSDLVKTLLSRSSLSVKELSEKLSINRSNYYLWTSSRSVPKQSTINRLADLLNLKVVWYDKNDGEIEDLDSSTSNTTNQYTDDLIHLQKMEIQIQ